MLFTGNRRLVISSDLFCILFIYLQLGCFPHMLGRYIYVCVCVFIYFMVGPPSRSPPPFQGGTSPGRGCSSLARVGSVPSAPGSPPASSLATAHSSLHRGGCWDHSAPFKSRKRAEAPGIKQHSPRCHLPSSALVSSPLSRGGSKGQHPGVPLPKTKHDPPPPPRRTGGAKLFLIIPPKGGN